MCPIEIHESLSMLNGLISAIRTLTLVPFPGEDAKNYADALIWFPAVGAVIGFLLFGVHLFFDATGLNKWIIGEGLFLVAVATILTRGIHLDGLADSFDGLFSMADKARSLEIMRDSRIGTFGALGIIFVIGLKWSAYVQLIETANLMWIVVTTIISRAAIVEQAVSLPYARREGGTGAPFIEGARPLHKVLSRLTALLLLIPFGPAAIVLVLVGWIFVKLTGVFFQRRVGGVTGDLLGASSELTETLCLVILALTAHRVELFLGWHILLR